MKAVEGMRHDTRQHCVTCHDQLQASGMRRGGGRQGRLWFALRFLAQKVYTSQWTGFQRQVPACMHGIHEYDAFC